MKKSIICTLLCYWSVWLMAQNYTSYFTGSLTDVVTNPIGGVCLMGGATEDDGAMRWFVNRASNGDVLVIRASGSNGYNDYLFNEIGDGMLNSVETIVFHNADAAYEVYIRQRIAQAEAIWIAGGDQYDYVSYWRNTPIATLINQAISERNIVIGGTSAGMAILGGTYFSAENGTVTSATALNNPYDSRVTVSNQDFLNVPYLDRVITDTHYDDPDRRGRHVVFLARAVRDYGQAYQGIACDEYTAVCIDEAGTASVYGTFPDFDDNAYFIRANCNIANNVPENCSSNSPLSWNQGGVALTTYRVKGTPTGLYTFDLNNWENGDGGDWEHWAVAAGNFSAEPTVEMDCAPVTTYTATNPPAHAIKVYPNPTPTGELTLEASTQLLAQVSLYDRNGQLLKHWDNVEASTDLDLSQLPTGVYMLEYLNSATRQLRRIVVR